MRGSSSCQDSHMLPLSVPSDKHTHEKVHDLGAAKQVTMWRDLSRYWVFYCFLTLSFIFLAASAKARYLGNLLHPSLLSRQVEKVIFKSPL